MQKTCAITGKQFEITDQDIHLYGKLDVPMPSICPEERHRRKLAFRNERFLYKRTCDMCRRDVVSMYDPETPGIFYCQKCWWSDNWNAATSGRDFDFERPFFEQFAELIKATPRCSLDNFDHENSEYCNFSCHNKNCYMIFGSWFNEKCMYGNTVLHNVEAVDVCYCNECKYCYELVDCEKCYELFYSQNCQSCSNSYFLFDCKSCQNCIFCWNLRNKQYHIFNKPVSKEEFEKTIRSFGGSYEKMRRAFQEYVKMVRDEAIHKFIVGEHNENVVGNYLYRCKNLNDVFYALEVSDVTHSIRTSKKQKDSVDIIGTSGGELDYETLHYDFCYRGKFCLGGEHCYNCSHCFYCYQCENCFGCFGLRHKKYCILNKQCSKEDYEKLVPKIIKHMSQPLRAHGASGIGESAPARSQFRLCAQAREVGMREAHGSQPSEAEPKNQEWGEFIPMKISPFPYNETVAQEFFPLTKEETVGRGLKWRDENPSASEKFTSLPDAITDTEGSVCTQTLACENCGKSYRIVQQEFEFYKKYSLPIPRQCFGCRHMSRLNLRPPYRLFERTCSNCKMQLKSSYSPDRPEKVYCQECYLEAVY